MDPIIRVKARVSGHHTYNDLAIRESRLELLRKYSRLTQVAALRHIVEPRLIVAEHCFKGLKRRVWQGPQGGDGENFWVYSFRVPYDVRHDWLTGNTVMTDPPAGAVYMVIAEPGTDVEKDKLSVHGWIRWWNWVIEDSHLKGAPVNPVGENSRFDSIWWSSGQI